jgi:hypothetical protein
MIPTFQVSNRPAILPPSEEGGIRDFSTRSPLLDGISITQRLHSAPSFTLLSPDSYSLVVFNELVATLKAIVGPLTKPLFRFVGLLVCVKDSYT